MRKYGKYFTVEVKPTIAAAYQHAEAYGNQDVLFDWTPFKVPNGGNRLVGLTMMYSGKGAADNAPCEILFARTTTGGGDIAAGTAPTTLGNSNAAAFAVTNNPSFRQIVGGLQILDNDFFHTKLNVASTQVATTNNHGIVLDGYGSSTEDLDDSEGMYTYYIGAISTGTPDFTSAVNINTGQTGENDIAVNGADPTIQFAPGDILHDEDNALIGTVGTVTTSTNILLEGDTTCGTCTNNKKVYNINPITIRMSFER
tara:strand:- start:357 stop:1124 length:768 start_codon:yes stop_codon:yes gene_type:complete